MSAIRRIECAGPFLLHGDPAVYTDDFAGDVVCFYQEKDCIRLQPQNPALEPIFTRDAQILGVVTGLFRNY